jgi:hypothetical protein
MCLRGTSTAGPQYQRVVVGLLAASLIGQYVLAEPAVRSSRNEGSRMHRRFVKEPD